MNVSEREAIAVLQVEVKHLASAIEALTAEVDTLKAQANRWKGAGILLVMLGGFGAWLVDVVESWFTG